MSRVTKNRARRIRNIIILMAVTGVMLATSTFAWFVGMRVVSVTSFDVDIASTDSLELSLNGINWAYEVTISEENLETVSYPGHKNTWGGDKGLIPISSVGDMDTASSRMVLYEKASITPTPGGYRLLASKVDNTDPTKDEPIGYVAFDLFIKNISGAQYLSEYNEDDEEAIYLLRESEVTVSSGGVKNTGIENSVRVAFAQVGRVKADTIDQGIVGGISCKTENGVTGICRKAQIWEPNDKDHVQSAINWYNVSCLKRTGIPVHEETSYTKGEDGKCGEIKNDNSYPTYVVKSPISSLDNINVYDGKEYNGYEASVLLEDIKPFTDSQKILTGVKRPDFMKLAPNSITKVRVYIYIEGQDIDNYDFASIGKRISVKFGFTKERFTIEDIDYEGPSDPSLPTNS